MIRTTITATQFKNQTGLYMEECKRAPVAITKHGRVSSVLLDAQLYNKLVHFANEARKAKLQETKR